MLKILYIYVARNTGVLVIIHLHCTPYTRRDFIRKGGHEGIKNTIRNIYFFKLKTVVIVISRMTIVQNYLKIISYFLPNFLLSST